VAAVAWAVLGLAQDRPTPADFGITGQSVTASSSARPVPAGVQGSASAGAISPATAQIAAADAVPTGLAIPTIHLQATVRPVHNVQGSLAVPDDPGEVGWWAAGALPGSATGSVVLDGHVDSPAGPGALFRLADLHAGDSISVATAGHHQLNYTVTGRRLIAKSRGLPSDLFSLDGGPRLVLISCGGPFDRTTRSYEDNIVVFATPA
jgi:hypothetical protein